MIDPPIYVVSLISSVERRARVRRRLEHHGLGDLLTFVDAVPTTAARDYTAEWRLRYAQACFASHLKAMRMMLEDARASSGAIICEDDILPHNEFATLLAGVLQNLPADARLCSLGWLTLPAGKPLQWAGRDRGRRNLCRLEPWSVWGMHCYWITPSYADELLGRYGDRGLDELPNIVETIAFEADGYVSNPPLALQDGIDSSLAAPGERNRFLDHQDAWPYEQYSAAEVDAEPLPMASRDTGHSSSIALCMIVRDESAVIERCLESVRPLIDAWVICDTGSTDGTPELIERVLSGVPGELHHRPWRDFGWNRTELMALAAGSADYLLLLDADMTIEWRALVPPLTEDVYLLSHAGDLAYRVPRLVRGDRRWTFVGSTHEYLSGEGRWSEAPLDALIVHHHADGGSRADKFTRDARLLERDLESDPDNPRTLFYLAQTLRDLDDDQAAIDCYERRVALGGWDEERFYAAFQAGSLRARRDQDEAIDALLSAWELRPQRAEPLFELARFCRFRGHHRLAYLFAERGAEIECPDDRLFVHRWVYDWGLQYELAAAAYWVDEIEETIARCEALLASPALPHTIADSVREILSYGRARRPPVAPAVTEETPLLLNLIPSFDVAEIRLEVEPAWRQFNPTIACDGDGYRVIVRTANYFLEDGGWGIVDEDGVVRTLNYRVRLGAGLEVQDVAALRDLTDGPPRYPSRIEGYEDCRLFEFRGRWFATASVRDRNPLQRAQMVLLELDDADVVSVRPLTIPWPTTHEKNWMPVALERELRFIYSCAPTVVLRCDPATGVCSVADRHETPLTGEIRGGSQGIAIGDNVLCVVHEARGAGATRRYDHRFVLFDEEYRIASVSRPFSFVSRELEFCSGLARRDDRLLLTFGVGDQAALLGVLDLDDALELLEISPTRARATW